MTLNFRGKVLQNVYVDCGEPLFLKDEFAYGNIVKSNTRCWIVGKVVDVCDEGLTFEYWCEVDPVTVGQFTGLHDKNGVKIWDGDIVRYGVSYERINKIIYEQGCFQLQGMGGLAPLRYHHLLDSNTPDVEVIGNVHDNRELLNECL